MTSKKCYCGTSKAFKECCEIYINGIQKAPTAEALMRSRYAAYASHNADYLVATTHVSQRKHHSKKDILDWATANNWLRLEILKTTENTVEFKAYFLDNAAFTLPQKLIYSFLPMILLLIAGTLIFNLELAVPSVIKFSMVFVAYYVIASFRPSKSLRK